MFGTDAAATLLYRLIAADPDVLTFAGSTDHIRGLPLLPDGMRPPAVLIHPDPANPSGVYDPRMVGTGTPPTSETLDMVVRLIAVGTSTDPIEAAAYAQLAACDGQSQAVTIRGRTFTVSVWAHAEVTQTYLILRDGTEARQLGTVYRCQVDRTG